LSETRAQALLAFGLALVGAVGALRQPVSEAHCTGLWVLWSATLVVAAWAVLGAAATAAVRADMNLIHAAVLSLYKPPVLKRLADDYAAVVMTGHDQVGTRLTNFRVAVT
jgi:hypothetical protein